MQSPASQTEIPGHNRALIEAEAEPDFGFKTVVRFELLYSDSEIVDDFSALVRQREKWQ
jgi:hypothetical protein